MRKEIFTMKFLSQSKIYSPTANSKWTLIISSSRILSKTEEFHVNSNIFRNEKFCFKTREIRDKIAAGQFRWFNDKI